MVRPHLSHFGIGVMVLKRSSLIWSEVSLTCSGISTECVYIGPLFRLRLLAYWVELRVSSFKTSYLWSVWVEMIVVAVWQDLWGERWYWVFLSWLAKEYWVRRELFADRTGDVRVWSIVDVDLHNIHLMNNVVSYCIDLLCVYSNIVVNIPSSYLVSSTPVRQTARSCWLNWQ